MKLIVGLGNPGSEYEKTRHNAGFLAIDELRTELNGTLWKLEKKWKAELSTATIDDEKIILMKPQTFMNSSGEAVGAVTGFYKVQPADVWVIHDELDFPYETIRIKVGGSAAGHNGIKSIIDAIGSDFVRFRIGINSPHEGSAEDFVLQKFSKEETKTLNTILKKTTEALITGLEKGVTTSMNQFNEKTQ